MESFTLPAFAKINWLLKILGKRDDGFHEIFTVFQTISLHDSLTFSESDKLELTCSDSNIPTDDKNLIIKAAIALQTKFGITSGAKLHLEKSIPSPGGLGGGSSDCAAALIGLAKLWSLDVRPNELIEIGSQLGSDVPFFFYGGTAVGIGRGNEISSVDDVIANNLVLVTPNEYVSTSEAYQRISAGYLTKQETKRILELCRKQAEDLCKKQFGLYNDFEKTVFESHPEVERVRNALHASGASVSLMSGSGASVFGIFENPQIQQKTVESFSKESGWKVVVAETVSRDQYREYFNTCRNLLPQ